MTVHLLDPGRADEAADVLSEAFAHYPVMRHVIGAADTDHERLKLLIEFLLAARVLRANPVFAVEDSGRIVGVATTTLPDQPDPPPALHELRERVWRQLGRPARERYEALGRVWQALLIPERHHHLNMIGVRRSHRGRRLGSQLLAAVHELAERDAGSAGVTLTTEDPANVPLYQHAGYRVLGHVRITDDLETWAFFRPAAAP